ncbi:MAG: D-alanyl-D-alanine carboxypeptidase [Ruminococcus sp.]|nr:D-alanyl-D-alanine carboxypeptidase [Ruminococcus sp.]
MKKRLNFIISLTLALALCLNVLSFPALSFENNVPISSGNVLLINTDTHTVVYNKNADAKCDSSYLTALMSFLIVCDTAGDIYSTDVEINEEFLDSIPESDGTLKRFAGNTLTIKDLMVFLLITKGHDAAYVLADYLFDSDIEAFVEKMNEKAAELGMKDTNYTTPCYDPEREAQTTCRDVYTLYSYALTKDIFKQLSSLSEYVPDGYDENTDKVYTEISIMSPNSPYYFRYVENAKYSYDSDAGAALVLTTKYRNSTYLFVAANGLAEAEENVYVDAKKLTTWAYLDLSDRKLVEAGDISSSVKIDSPWRVDEVTLTTAESPFRTIPKKYESAKFSVEFDIPEHVALPVFEGQGIGSATVLYDGNPIESIPLSSTVSKGISMLPDLGAFIGAGYASMFPVTSEKSTKDDSQVELTE